MDRIRKHLSVSNVIPLVALFVALGGTTYAAVTLPKNSVKAREIARNAVGASEIKASAVRTGEVRNGSLVSSDFAAGQLAAGDRGDKGPRGDQGTQGVQGVAGPPGIEGPTAFARVQADGTLQPNPGGGLPPQNLGIVAANVVKGEGGAATGNYCFNTAFRPASALVSLDHVDAAAADRNLVVSIAIDRGPDLGDCPATHNDARVRIVDANTGTAQDARFFVWFQQ